MLREGEVAVAPRPESVVWRKYAVAAVTLLALVASGDTWWSQQPDIEPTDPAKYAFKLPEKPSIAVLLFDNLSGSLGQQYLADGLSETIISALSTIPEMFIISRNSFFTFKGKAVKIQQVAEEFGVRYVLEGSVQQDGNKLRVTAQLIDAISGHHLWANRYDRDSKDLFAVQDDEAISVQERAIELALSSAVRYVVLAISQYYAGAFQETVTLARKAMRLHPRHTSWYFYRPGTAYMMLGEYEKGIATIKGNDDTSPDSVVKNMLLATAYSMGGRVDEARELVSKILSIRSGYSVKREAVLHRFRNTEYLEKSLKQFAILVCQKPTTQIPR